MALPVTLLHHDDEAAIDLVARLAAANGFPSLRDFLDHTETTAAAIARGDADALSLVSVWSSVPVGRLKRLAAVGSGAGGTWQMGCAALSKDMRPGRVQRFCAQCVLQDQEREAGRIVSRAYRRAWWSIRSIEGCPDHECMLTTVTVDAGGDVHDFPRFVQANLAQIQQAAAAPTSSRRPMLDRYLRDRVFSDSGGDFLDGLDTHVAAEFCRYLGDFLALHEVGTLTPEGVDAEEWGFNLAKAGEDEVQRVVIEVIDRKRPKAKYVESVLGPMVHWLRRNIGKDAYQPVIDLMQKILERHMPFGEGQIILRPVQTRHMYCVNSAHADYGITKDRIRALMKANDPSFQAGPPDSRTYFDAQTLRPILEAAQETLNSRQAGEALGVSEEMVHGLLSAGIMTEVEKRTDGTRAFVRIHKNALETLVQSLGKLTSISSAKGLLPLSSAVPVFHRPFHALVKMALAREVEAFLLPGEGPIFDRVYISPPAPLGQMSRRNERNGNPLSGGDDELMRLKEAELALGTTTMTISALIKLGYLRHRTVRRDTGQKVKFVERQSLAEFHATYASLSEIAKSRQGYRAAIKVELEEAGLKPIFEPEGFIARFYIRSDVARVGGFESRSNT